MSQTFVAVYSGTFDGTTFTVNDFFNFSTEVVDNRDGAINDFTEVGSQVSVVALDPNPLTVVGTTNEGVVLKSAFENYLLLANNVNIQTNTPLTVDATTPYTYDVVCFAAGTLIATQQGEQAVESLGIGDLLLTADGGTTFVKWIGTRTLHKMFTPQKQFTPVRVSAGALGQGLPNSDLVLTADHALIIDGFAINAGALVNGTTITFEAIAKLTDRVTYYHIETEAHEVILANNAAAESFIDYVGRQAFDNYSEYTALYGGDRELREMPLPRVTAARLLPPEIRARLAGRQAA